MGKKLILVQIDDFTQLTNSLTLSRATIQIVAINLD